MDKIQEKYLSNPILNEKTQDYDVSPSEKRKQLKKIYLKLFIASQHTAGSFVFEWMPNIISVYFIGRANITHGIDAYGLGFVWIDCFGYGILQGLCVGLETMISQAFGGQRYQLCGQLYNRALCILIATFFICTAPLCFLSEIVGLINKNDELVYEAGQFVRFMIPAVFMNALYVCTKCYLNGLNIYNYQFYTQTIATLCHILWCYLFIERLGLGLLGCAISLALTEFMGFVLLLLLMKVFSSNIIVTKCTSKSSVSFSKQSLQNWKQYLKLAIPIGSVMWLENIGFQVYSLYASFLSESQFSASVILFTFAILYYQFAYGVSIATTTYVGKQMGNKNVSIAKKTSMASLVIITIFLVITQIILHFLKAEFIIYFTNDAQVSDSLNEVFILMQILTIFDSYQAILTGIARAIGKENFACMCFIFFYLVVGSISGYLFVFYFQLQLQGVWYAMIIGAGSYSLVQIINLLFCDWELQVSEIEQKIENQDFQQVI